MRTTVDQSLSEERTVDDWAWTLSIAHHDHAEWLGNSIALEPSQPLTLGRDAALFGEGALSDERLSREHAEIGLDGTGQPVLRDLGSRNRTYVNGSAIESRPLRDGDTIGIGGILLLAHRAPARWSPATEATLVGRSHAHAALVDRISAVAARRSPLVIRGEVGAGKTAAAHAVHHASGRSGGLAMVDCRVDREESLELELFGCVPGAFGGGDERRPGALQKADGGTLLLDSVGDASEGMQAALERFLETGEVQPLGSSEPVELDLCVIATTVKPISQLVSEGRLRDSFASRLSGAVLVVPPLRERLLDVPFLAAHFVDRYAGAPRPLHRKLMLALLRHPWLRNVRELEAVIEQTVLEAPEQGPLRLTDPISRLLADGRATPVAEGLRDGPADSRPARQRLAVSAAGSWFACGDQERVQLEHRPTLARILGALAKRRRDAPGEPLTVSELLSAGWPEEKVLERAGSNRVYVALTTLRRLGLQDLIQRSKYGYWLDAEAPIDIDGG